MKEYEELKIRYEKLIANQEKVIAQKAKERVNEILSPIFTPGQIKKLLHPNQTTVKWSSEDIASAIALRSVSPKAYRYLKNNKIPLPALSTLRKWASKINIKDGVIDSVLSLMH